MKDGLPSKEEKALVRNVPVFTVKWPERALLIAFQPLPPSWLGGGGVHSTGSLSQLAPGPWLFCTQMDRQTLTELSALLQCSEKEPLQGCLADLRHGCNGIPFSLHHLINSQGCPMYIYWAVSPSEQSNMYLMQMCIASDYYM